MLAKLRLIKHSLPQSGARYLVCLCRNFARSASSVPSGTDKVIDDAPLQYFGSKAAAWRARDTHSGGGDDTVWYQPYVVTGSMAIFLLYFLVFREESDIDRKLEGNLFDHVSGLEEVQLIVNYKQNKHSGGDTADLEKRLIELGVDVKQLELEIKQGK